MYNGDPVTDYETVSINIETNLKRKLEEYNFYHKDNKINLSALSRDSLKKELEIRSQSEKTEVIPQSPKKEKEITCLNCGNTVTAKRSTRKFCSYKCKTAYYRK